MAVERVSRGTIEQSDREITAETPESVEELSIAEILAELGAEQEAKVTVYRRVHGRAAGSWLFEYGLGDFALGEVMTRLRDQYKGGNFRLIIKNAGTNRIIRNIPVDVESPADDFLSRDRTQQPPPPSVDLAGVMTQMRDMLFQQQADNQRMIVDIIKATSESRSSGSSLTELVQSLAALQQLSPKEKSGTDPQEMLQLFFEGMKQGREMAEEKGGADESVLQTAIKTFGPQLAEITKHLNISVNAPPPQAMVPRGTAPQSLPPARAIAEQPAGAPPTPETVNDSMQQWQQLQPFAAMLMRAAQLDADVEVYANLLLDQVPEEIISEWLESDEKYALLLGYLPAETTHLASWFDSLRQAVLELIASENDNQGDDDAPQQQGNAAVGG